jgi:hypothetical protein
MAKHRRKIMSHTLFRAAFAGLITVAGLATVDSPASAAGADGLRQNARICSPLTAVRKARAMGLRGAEIRDMTARRVVVVGHGRRGEDRIVFANMPGCPLFHR